MTLSGDGFNGLGAVTTAGTDATVNGDITLATDTSIRNDFRGTALILNGAVTSGFTLTTYGTGVVRLENSAAIAAATIGSGTLELNGTLDTATVLIASGSRLAGSGTCSCTLAATTNSSIAPGMSGGAGVGLLTAGTLQVNAVGVQPEFQLGPAPALSDQLALTVELLNNASGTLAFLFSDGAAPPVPGVTYTLITFPAQSGFSVGDFQFSYAGIDAPGTPAAMTGSFTLTATALEFTPSMVVSDLLFRDGFD